MPDIVVKKTHDEPGETSLAVTVPPESVRAAEDRATRAYQQRARLPGFRQGKAPAAVVRKKFAEDIRQQALQELVQESWRAAVEQEKLKPIADPHIHNLKWEEGAPVTFELHVEVKPDMKLERLGGFRLTRTVPAVRCSSRSVTFGRVSVVIIARDVSSQPASLSSICGRAAAILSTGSLKPMTPVLATATS